MQDLKIPEETESTQAKRKRILISIAGIVVVFGVVVALISFVVFSAANTADSPVNTNGEDKVFLLSEDGQIEEVIGINEEIPENRDFATYTYWSDDRSVEDDVFGINIVSMPASLTAPDGDTHKWSITITGDVPLDWTVDTYNELLKDGDIDRIPSGANVIDFKQYIFDAAVTDLRAEELPDIVMRMGSVYARVGSEELLKNFAAGLPAKEFEKESVYPKTADADGGTYEYVFDCSEIPIGVSNQAEIFEAIKQAKPSIPFMDDEFGAATYPYVLSSTEEPCDVQLTNKGFVQP